MTDAEQAGLAETSVAQFAEMGFPREKVVSCDYGHRDKDTERQISVLKKLNYRGNNINDATTQTVGSIFVWSKGDLLMMSGNQQLVRVM
jgi:hypothetical protein